MQARFLSFLVWVLVAASAMFWALRLFVKAPAAPANTLAVVDSQPSRVDLSRLLGVTPVESVSAPVSAISSRFQLTGVMSPKQPGGPGIALIAVDGKLPRAFRLGAAIDGDLVLQKVSLRTASIGPTDGPPAVVLELPVLPPPATGVLPMAGAIAPLAPVTGTVPRVATVPEMVAPVAPSPVNSGAPHFERDQPPAPGASPQGPGRAPAQRLGNPRRDRSE